MENLDTKFRIKISTANSGKPFIKQLQSFNPVWDNCEFFINENITECDLWVVYGGLAQKESVLVAKENTLFITNEPPSVKKYQKEFLNQFEAVITCHHINHPHVIHTQQSLPWWVGHQIEGTSKEYSKTYDELKSITNINKTKTISLIASNKTFTTGHKKRYVFLKKIQEVFGTEIDIFGIGFNPINDKWDAIAPYKYHIVLENSSYPDYFTEKLSDAFLGLSYPIYYGCPNIYDYFPKNTVSQIDIGRPDEAIETIKNIIRSNQYEQSLSDLQHAKDLILDTYQLFPALCTYANRHIKNKEKILFTLKPEKGSYLKSFIRKIIKIPLRILKKKENEK